MKLETKPRTAIEAHATLNQRRTAVIAFDPASDFGIGYIGAWDAMGVRHVTGKHGNSADQDAEHQEDHQAHGPSVAAGGGTWHK